MVPLLVKFAKSLKNSGKLAVIEPDRSAWDLLSRNLHVNNCKASLVMGVLSHEILLFTSSGYATRTVVNPNVSEYYRRSHKKHPSAERTIVRYSFAEVEKLLGSTINTILLDREGCLPNVIGELKAPIGKRTNPDNFNRGRYAERRRPNENQQHRLSS